MARAAKRVVICLDNTGYEASLVRWKIYVSLADRNAERLDQIRVIDESARTTSMKRASSRRCRCRSRSVVQCSSRHNVRVYLGGQYIPAAPGRHPAVVEAQDNANGVLLLFADAAKYVTGQEPVIDAGMTAGGRPG